DIRHSDFGQCLFASALMRRLAAPPVNIPATSPLAIVFCAQLKTTMYRLIGADQMEYGPVPAEQVRKWIAEGRADALTRARAEEGGDWKPLSDFPEFAGALAGQQPVASVAPPRIGGADGERLAAEIIGRDYAVDIGDYFSRSWKLVEENFWLLVGATA